MNKWSIVRTVFGFTALLFSVLYTTTASAYIFGPPNVTELAEVGESANNLSLFSRTEADIFDPSEQVKSYGIAGVSKHGDKSGAIDFMYRLSKNTLSTPALEQSGFDIGGGVGGEWNFLSDRSLGLIANFQFDAGTWEYSKGSTNSGLVNTFGAEVGGLYRLFMGTSTVAPFVMLNQFVTTNDVYASSGAKLRTLTNTGSTTSYGVAVIIGKFTLSYTQTSSNSRITTSASSATSDVNTTGRMLTLGFNF